MTKVIEFPKTGLKAIEGGKGSVAPLHQKLAREFAITTALLDGGLSEAASEHAGNFIRFVRELRIREINDPRYNTPEEEFGTADQFLPEDDLEAPEA